MNKGTFTEISEDNLLLLSAGGSILETIVTFIGNMIKKDDKN